METWSPPKTDAERIAELEKRVQALELRSPWPVYIPYPVPQPYQGFLPNWWQPNTYLGNGYVGVGAVSPPSSIGGCLAFALPPSTAAIGH